MAKLIDDPADRLPATAFHDDAGYPIHIGDVLRIFHFRHRLRKRRCYFYRIVIDSPDGPMVAGLFRRKGVPEYGPHLLGMMLRNWEITIVANHDVTCFFERKKVKLLKGPLCPK